MAENKTASYRDDFANVEREIERIIKKISHFPSSQELRREKKSTLSAVISQHYGGFFTVRERMGYQHLRLENDHYKDWQAVKDEMTKVMDTLGHYPSQKELNKYANGSLVASIYKHHGGLDAVRHKIGNFSDREDRGYWQNWENLERRLKKTIDKIGHFPSHSELKSKRLHSVSRGIMVHGGTKAVREKMGYTETRRSSFYWLSWDNVEKELRSLIKQHNGTLPALSNLRGYKGLLKAITKRHGGMLAVKDRIGIANNTRPPYYWTKWENVQKELEEIVKQLGHFPSQREFRKVKKSTLSFAIHKYHGGVAAVRNRMGYIETNSMQELESLLENYVGGQHG